MKNLVAPLKGLLKSVFCMLVLSSCATYQTQISDAYSALQAGQPQVAAEKLKSKALEPSDDQLVYLLEYAVALQLSGQLEESNKALMMADKIADIQDYHSLSKIAGSLVLNQEMVQYKGEDFEKLLINVYLAINFSLMGQYDEALVEVRRLNQRLQKYRIEAKRDYEQNAFARYLSAMLYEEEKNWDSAIIDYEEVFRLNPTIQQLQQDLLFSSKKAHRNETFNKYKKQFMPTTVSNERTSPQKFGELVFIYQQGQGPQKKPHPQFPRIPKLYERSSDGVRAKISVKLNTEPAALVFEQQTQPIWSVQDVAIKTLDDLYAGLIAGRVAGLAAKAVVADQVRQKNPLLGDLTWIGLQIIDRADLRQWATLPESFQVSRLWLPPGSYQATVEALDSSSQATGEKSELLTFTILAGKKSFINWRSWK